MLPIRMLNIKPEGETAFALGAGESALSGDLVSALVAAALSADCEGFSVTVLSAATPSDATAGSVVFSAVHGRLLRRPGQRRRRITKLWPLECVSQ